MNSGNIIVVKVGTSSLTDSSGAILPERIETITSQLAALTERGKKPVLVTSGAIAAGFRRLGFRKRPRAIPDKQASAAVGQGLLMEQYAESLMQYGLACGQLLLNKDDFANRQRYNNAFNSIQVLLSRGAVPIINENDAVAVDEIKIGDNDTLSAQVAAMLHAERLIMLTDIDGLYTGNPHTDPHASRIDRVEAITPELLQMAGGAGSANGTGGMITKLRGALIATAAGVETVICSFREHDAVLHALDGVAGGTYFAASGQALHARKQWLAFYAESCGNLYVDEGAARALRERGSSLLAAGIVAVEGEFVKGDVVDVYARGTHELLGRGLARCSRSDVARAIRSSGSGLEVIHRDDWVRAIEHYDR